MRRHRLLLIGAIAIGTAGLTATTASAKLTAHFQRTQVVRGHAATAIVSLPYASPLRAGLVLKSKARQAEHGDATVVRAVTPFAPLVLVNPVTGRVKRTTRVSIPTAHLARGTYLLVLQEQRVGRWLNYVPGLFVQDSATVTLRVR